MSVMIGVSHNGKIAIASDSLWAAGWNHHGNVIPKVVRRDGFLLTVGPSSGFEQVLWEEITSLAGKEEDWPSRWSRHCLSGEDATPIQRLRKDHKDEIVVAWNGRLFQVRTSGGVFEPSDGIAECGCGGDYARAIAHFHISRNPDMTAAAIACAAVEVACELSVGCAPPIVCEQMDSKADSPHPGDPVGGPPDVEPERIDQTHRPDPR